MTHLENPDRGENQNQEEAKAKGTTISSLLAQILSAITTAHLNGLSPKEPASLDSNLRQLQPSNRERGR